MMKGSQLFEHSRPQCIKNKHFVYSFVFHFFSIFLLSVCRQNKNDVNIRIACSVRVLFSDTFKTPKEKQMVGNISKDCRRIYTLGKRKMIRFNVNECYDLDRLHPLRILHRPKIVQRCNLFLVRRFQLENLMVRIR